MKKKFLSVFIVCIMVLLNVNVIAENNTLMLYISTDGSDANDGSIGSPFATVAKAQDYIKNLSDYPSGGVCVNIRGGDYILTDTIKFSAENSGKEGAPVIYRSYPGERAVFSGIAPLCYKNFTEVNDDKVKEKIPQSVLPHVKQMDLSDKNVDLGHLFRLGQDYKAEDCAWSELVFDDNIMDIARYPNDKKYLYVEDVKSNGIEPDDGSEFTTSDPVLKSLTDEKDLWTYGWFIWYWTNNLEKIAKVDPSDGVIKTEVPIKAHDVVRVSKNQPYYMINSPAFIDTPGEYYIDRENQKLYFYPPKDVEGVKIGLTALKKNMIEMTNTNNVIFRDITFEDSRAGCFETNGCTNLIIDGCTIKNFAYAAVDLWGANNCQLLNSELYNIGCRAINVEGGNAETLTSCGVRIVNNEIHKIGRINKTQATAVWAHGYNGGTPGLYIGHNKIYDTPFQSVSVGMNGIIEYNEIFDCANEAADMGAIYLGGSYINGRGVKVRNNYIHDIPCNFEGETGYGTNGIYLDIDACGYEVYNNVVANVDRNFYYSSEGGYNKVYNNVFIGNKDVKSIKEFPTSSQTIRVIGSGINDDNATVKAKVKPFAYESELWKTTFPEIAESLTKEHPLWPSHKIENNIMYNCREMAICDETYQDPYTSIKNNWIKDTDPGFVDLEAKNYQLKPDADVLKEVPDFKIIDMSEIGLRSERVSEGEKVPGISDEVQSDDKPAILSEIKDCLVLGINEPKALKNGNSMYIDSNNNELSPIISENRTLVPVRFISEAFGARVGWKSSTNQIAVLYGDKTVILQIGNNVMNVNEKEVGIDTPPVSIDNRTFVPLRAISEALDKKVTYNNGIIIISDTEKNLTDDLILKITQLIH